MNGLVKGKLQPLIRFLVTTNITWKLLSLLYKIAYRFKFERDLISIEEKQQEDQVREKRVKALFGELTVLHGFFKGMKYPTFESHGSSLYPKLLGSYESELSNVIEQICSAGYKEIIDVGCAEGFYAVGLAVRNPGVKIFAFDIDPLAVAATKRMAETNKVSEQITFGSFCSADTLKNFKFSGRSLVISDCEGFEIKLFDRENICNLRNSDILIEMHDGKNERVSPYLLNLFKNTHDCEIIQSVNCFTKASQFSELNGLTEEELEVCLRERTGIMQWAFFTAKGKIQ